MRDTVAVLKDGRTFAGPLWDFRPKEGWFTLITEDRDAPDPFYFRDCVEVYTDNERLSYTKIGREDELARARENGWDGT